MLSGTWHSEGSERRLWDQSPAHSRGGAAAVVSKLPQNQLPMLKLRLGQSCLRAADAPRLGGRRGSGPQSDSDESVREAAA